VTKLTEIREALTTLLEPIAAEVLVVPAGGKVEEGSENFAVRLTVGEPSPENELRVDALLGSDVGSVRAVIQANPEIGLPGIAAQVVSHNGYRLYPQPDGSARLGTEVVVRVFG
jgi:hypothetical protein